MLLSVAVRRTAPAVLDDETREAVRRSREEVRRGAFASDDDMAAFFKRHGV
jgi:hypothetical protein